MKIHAALALLLALTACQSPTNTPKTTISDIMPSVQVQPATSPSHVTARSLPNQTLQLIIFADQEPLNIRSCKDSIGITLINDDNPKETHIRPQLTCLDNGIHLLKGSKLSLLIPLDYGFIPPLDMDKTYRAHISLYGNKTIYDGTPLPKEKTTSNPFAIFP
ncbi:hypothetical protein LU276_09820 [Moraxella haemolytica]|uniref:hypothetical protein n=1 Tax=Moraxella haemolytica TaxID=2904119 RepID=UPI00254371FD|nr:hypothetical protein [Moraxella sp. ZY171148]WII95273.1 hypothetical protein LU276_09820 [Moraxella sp. ZY171148]